MKRDRSKRNQSGYFKKYYQKNRARIRANVKKWYDANIPKVRATSARYLVKLRLEAFSHYGGAVCACCGETNILFLTLDHINGDGKNHTARARGGMYAWLRKHHYPPLALRVLCYNCNCGRERNKGICPHYLTTTFSPKG